MTDDQRNKLGLHLLDQVLPAIRKNGWVVQAMVDPEDDPGMQYALTVGLTEAGLPELVISGWPPEQSARLLNGFARLHLDREIRAGAEVVAPPALVPFRAVAAPGALGGPAITLYGRNATFLQLVWPDKDGAYPGDEGWTYADEVQPLFSTPRQDPPTNDGYVKLAADFHTIEGCDF